MNYSFEKLKQYFKELNPLSNVHLFLGCTFPVDTLSPGARYLYEHVIFELMKGREIFTGPIRHGTVSFRGYSGSRRILCRSN